MHSSNLVRSARCCNPTSPIKALAHMNLLSSSPLYFGAVDISCPVCCLLRFDYTVTRVMLQLNFVEFALPICLKSLLCRSSAEMGCATNKCFLKSGWCRGGWRIWTHRWMAATTGQESLASNSARTQMVMGLFCIAQAHCLRSN